MLEQTWLSVVTTTDPGTGKINFNNVSIPLTTRIAISISDRFSSSFATWIDMLDDSTNPVKGVLHIEEVGDTKSWVEFRLNAVLPGSASFRLLDVTFINQGVSFANNDIVGLVYARAGDQGNAGTNGTNGTNGLNGADGAGSQLQFLFSATTTDSDPGLGTFRFNQAIVANATMLYIDLADRYGSNVQPWIETWDDSGNTIYRTLLEFTARTDPSVWWRFKVTGAVTVVTGYAKVPIAFLAASTVSPANGAGMGIGSAITGSIGPQGVEGPQGVQGPPGEDGPPVDVDAFTGTSTTLVSVGLGFKTLVTQLDRVWMYGQRLRAASIDAAKILEGSVSEYHADTGSLTLSVDLFHGAGDHNEWFISIAGEQGEPGLQGSPGPITTPPARSPKGRPMTRNHKASAICKPTWFRFNFG
jgi:hypothetical protein